MPSVLVVFFGLTQLEIDDAGDPKQVPDFIALRGDASDRIPGAAGVDPVGAATLLKKYGSLENALAAGRFARSGREAPALSVDRHDGQVGSAASAA